MNSVDLEDFELHQKITTSVYKDVRRQYYTNIHIVVFVYARLYPYC